MCSRLTWQRSSSPKSMISRGRRAGRGEGEIGQGRRPRQSDDQLSRRLAVQRHIPERDRRRRGVVSQSQRQRSAALFWRTSIDRRTSGAFPVRREDFSMRRTAGRGAAGTTSRPSEKSGDKSPHSISGTRLPHADRHFWSHPVEQVSW